MAEWLRRLTRKPKVRTAVGSSPTLDSLVAVRYTSPGRPEPCEGNLVAVAGSCGGVMVKHPWPLLEISLSDFRGLATLNINTYLPELSRYLAYISFSYSKYPSISKVFKYFPRKPFVSQNLPLLSMATSLQKGALSNDLKGVVAKNFSGGEPPDPHFCSLRSYLVSAPRT